MKKSLTFLVMSIVMLTACSKDDTSISEVQLDKTKLTLDIGGTETLRLIILPEKAGNQSVKWESSDPEVATVSQQGDLIALNAGTTTITATAAENGMTASCLLTVSEKRSIRFKIPEGTVWHEEAGIIEIPLDIGETSKITGKIEAECLRGTSEGDFEILTPEFSSNGYEIFKIKVALRDNDEFGDWSFRLKVKELSNGAPDLSTIITIKDDERILGFEKAVYEVEEGKAVWISYPLKGGATFRDIPVDIEVVYNGTTALPGQFVMPPSPYKIIKGEDAGYIYLETKHDASHDDKEITLRIRPTIETQSPGKILTDNFVTCKVIIKNVDRSISFKEKEFTKLYRGTYSIPITCTNLDRDATVSVKVKQTTGSPEGFELSNGGILTIPAKTTEAKLQLTLKQGLEPGQSIEFEIAQVAFGSEIDNTVIDSEKSSFLCKPTDINGFNSSIMDYKRWSIKSCSSDANPSIPSVSHILDGNILTYWAPRRDAPSPYTIVIDTHSNNGVVGFYLSYPLGVVNNYIQSVCVEMSHDEVTWAELGVATAFERNYIPFQSKTRVIDGRYIRITIEASQPDIYVSDFSLIGEKW